MTPQRRVILDELRLIETHPTAREVFDRVRRRLPHISLGTVYRNLDVLSRHGLIRRLEVNCPERRYDADTDSHYHLCCVRCGRIVDAPMEPLHGLEEALGEASGYEVIGHRLEFKGVCPNCRAGSTDTPRGERCGSDTSCPDEEMAH